ncbi:hypothetical protein [Terriglobus saanensis]|uniref:hypothetical protein n=1 Tax=Terriglobus saanensis TaxID=870903 RepID=UPI0003148A43|nr:hypothetical protein [Terriglobus saanensis]
MRISILPLMILIAAVSLISFNRIPISSVFADGPNVVDFTGYAHYTFNNLHNPTGLAVANGNLYIADTGNNVIKMFNPSLGTLSVLAGSGTAGYNDGSPASAQFNTPTGLSAVYTAQDIQSGPGFPPTRLRLIEIRINDTGNNAIRRMCIQAPGDQVTCQSVNGLPNGQVVTMGGGSLGDADGNGSASRFNSPTGFATDGLLIGDTGNNSIRTMDANNNAGTLIASQVPGFIDGNLSVARFSYPTVALATPIGTLIVDSGNHAIRLLNGANQVTTLAGNGTAGYADGQGNSARFNKPTQVVYNSGDGAYYIADTFNNCIRRMDSAGNVTTYAGIGGQSGLVDGASTSAKFDKPTGIAIANGYLYVADSGNNAIRRVDMNANIVSTYIN